VLEYSFVSLDEPLLLLDGLPVVFNLLLLENIVEQVLTCGLVHIEHLGSYYVFYFALRQVVQQVPILVVVILLLQGFVRVLHYISPLFLRAQLLEQLGVVVR